ncbi:hypothetical protein [Metabacillus halosaccharovorans]|uniref:hypothetical protein n=1 Tax=Metabacillus halosaccharovorans TaxID=930124 RepID=UPI000C805DA6|nr:hypothetical protein [Metabacillus halosaccharovorans]MCM3443629.1 hypothetical protein [Metabacillus halosaccharovorans]PMC36210.1 hypothetical protein CJ195_15460 [Bacillus sp. UMB0899]
MRKSTLVYIIISIIILAAIYIVASTIYKGDYKSEEYHFEGKSENWNVSAKIVETGAETYSLNTEISYLYEGDIPERVKWVLNGNKFGTGGEQSLTEGRIVKKEPLREIIITENDKITFSIEWNNQSEENIVLTPKTNK